MHKNTFFFRKTRNSK